MKEFSADISADIVNGVILEIIDLMEKRGLTNAEALTVPTALYKAMLRGMIKKFPAMPAETHIQHMIRLFESMIEDVRKDLGLNQIQK